MEEFSVSIFWENKREEVTEAALGHMRVSMEELGLKQQSCFQIPAGSITCASQTCLYKPYWCQNHHRGTLLSWRGWEGWMCIFFYKAEKAQSYVRNWIFLFRLVSRALNPDTNSLPCSSRSKTIHNAGSFHKVTLKFLPCSKHLNSSFP